MKVILLENVRKIGSIGEIIDVKRGFARNYLISHKKALFASKENIKEVEKLKTELNKKDQDKKNTAKEISEKIQNKEFIIKKLSTENKELYGSVKPTEISKIKSIGLFNVILNLHSEIQIQIKIKVVPQEEVQ